MFTGKQVGGGFTYANTLTLTDHGSGLSQIFLSNSELTLSLKGVKVVEGDAKAV